MTLTVVAALMLALAQAAPAKPTPKTPPAQTPPAQTTPAQPTPAQTAPAATTPAKPGAKPSAANDALATQVMLDRAGFSPGVIDGQAGPSTRRALAAYQKQAGADSAAAAVEPLTRYAITPEDVAGPFAEQIPKDLVDQAKLPALAYQSPVEALAERFHTTPEFLKKLNPGAKFAAGEEIQVPNVVAMVLPTETKEIAAKPQRGQRGDAGRRGERGQPGVGTTGQRGQPSAATDTPVQDVILTVSRSASALTVTDAASGRILHYAPVTTGSTHDPLPIGEWKVTGITLNPPFNYNPDLFWDAQPKDTKAKLPPGPNNPVGSVWIDLSKEHYGIHGTPEPRTVGKTQSHGCVRLTNWDALSVATLVKPGTKVIFTE
jgi:lipoprotein-anchoring transpeptidase ErfK/SrfK